MKILWGILIALLASCQTLQKQEDKKKVPENPINDTLPLPSASDLWSDVRRHTLMERADYRPIHPSVSKDGKTIVYASNELSSNRQIFLKSFDGSFVKQLTFGSSDNLFPALSPDGKKVAFCSNRSCNWDIYILFINSPSSLIQATLSSNDEIAPSWSPDGKSLAYSIQTQSGVWLIATVDIATRTPTYLGPGLYPKWSPHEKPEDQLIAFQELKRDGLAAGVWTVKTDGTDLRKIVSDRDNKKSFVCPGWAPDGKWLVFSATVKYENSMVFEPEEQAESIYLIKPDGTYKIKLTHDIFNNWWPTWGSDRIFFVSNREGVQNIFSLKHPKDLE